MYPPYPTRLTNFTRDLNNGVTAPSAAGVDAELNQAYAILYQTVTWLRSITNADGTLTGVAVATAQALAGSQRFVATASQTVFLTTITWQSAFSNLSVMAEATGVRIDPNSVAVANSGGFLQVTLPAQATSTVVVISAFEAGDGLLTRLQTAGSATDGANLVSIRDVASIIVATTVEGALQEIATNLATLTTSVGTTAGLIRSNGSVAFAAAQSMGGFKLTNLADGVSAQDAVTVNQFNAYTAVWNALQTYFLRLDGTTPMAAALPMGANKITGLANGTAATDAAAFGQLATYLPLAGGAMSGPIVMGTQKITNLLAGTVSTDAVNKAQLDAVSSSSAGYRTLGIDITAAGLTNYTVPVGVTNVMIEAWSGGGGTDVSARPGGGGGGAAVRTFQAVNPGDILNCTVGAGGTAAVAGGTTSIINGASTLISVPGGGASVGGGGGAGGTGASFLGTNGMAFTGGHGFTGVDTGGGGGWYGAGGDAAMGGGQGGIWGAYPYYTGLAGTAPGGGAGGGSVGAAGRIIIRY